MSSFVCAKIKIALHACPSCSGTTVSTIPCLLGPGRGQRGPRFPLFFQPGTTRTLQPLHPGRVPFRFAGFYHGAVGLSNGDEGALDRLGAATTSGEAFQVRYPVSMAADQQVRSDSVFTHDWDRYSPSLGLHHARARLSRPQLRRSPRPGARGVWQPASALQRAAARQQSAGFGSPGSVVLEMVSPRTCPSSAKLSAGESACQNIDRNFSPGRRGRCSDRLRLHRLQGSAVPAFNLYRNHGDYLHVIELYWGTGLQRLVAVEKMARSRVRCSPTKTVKNMRSGASF